MSDLLYIPGDHPLNKIRKDLKEKLRASQESLIELDFKDAHELFARGHIRFEGEHTRPR